MKDKYTKLNRVYPHYEEEPSKKDVDFAETLSLIFAALFIIGCFSILAFAGLIIFKFIMLLS